MILLFVHTLMFIRRYLTNFGIDPALVLSPSVAINKVSGKHHTLMIDSNILEALKLVSPCNTYVEISSTVDIDLS